VHVASRRPTSADLDSLISRLSNADLTYPEVGGTGNATLPSGYHHDRYSVALGQGDDVFRRGQEALRRWEAHRGAGADVYPADAALVTGTIVVVTLHLGPLYILAPCRIVSVTGDENSFGFAYGTLPGHPESGEEAFHIKRREDGEVSFEVVVFSRIADPIARLGNPIARLVQQRMSKRYLRGMQRFVTSTH
jgi:uncharacterized protein (UPF0548 family)